eukprot:GHVN01024058.1.p1 GENE.GHVN01024058.1~~GHVN01024058.1.p1  ORF type:complete len:624 (-),score=53.31 GHVN01024058.1:1243-3015(-)
MGKQSTGKSFWINHFTGTLFDVSGGRCTDGCWLSCALLDNKPGCLVIALDFEGLGSVERTAQEDRALSLLNAGISSLSVLRCGSALDRDMRWTFDNLQRCAKVFPSDRTLFKGMLMIAPKDVLKEDIKRVTTEITTKMTNWTNEVGTGDDNFITALFPRGIAISPFYPITNNDYFTALKKNAYPQLFPPPAQQDDTPTCFPRGLEFSENFRMLMAKLAVSDWSTPVDAAVCGLRYDFIYRHLGTALQWGAKAISTEAGGVHVLEELRGRNHELIEIIDHGRGGDEVRDSGLQLCQVEKDWTVAVPYDLRKSIFGDAKRNGKEGDRTSYLVKRRCERVKKWVESLASDTDGAHYKALEDKMKMLEQSLESSWQVCKMVCAECFNECLLQRGHTPSRHPHSCLLSDHKCQDKCSICPSNKCCRQSGHGGDHFCKEANHICRKACSLVKARCCSLVCAKEIWHEGDHRCDALGHRCLEACSLAECPNKCESDYGQPHETHKCIQVECPSYCATLDCGRKCNRGHFHSSDSGHTCGEVHKCDKQCGDEGICIVDTQMRTTEKVYNGKLSSFFYVSHNEQTIALCCSHSPRAPHS